MARGGSRRRGSSTSARGHSAGQSDSLAEPASTTGGTRSTSVTRRSARLANPSSSGGPSDGGALTPSDSRPRTRSTSARETSSATSGPSSTVAPVAGPSSAPQTAVPPRTPRKQNLPPNVTKEIDSTPVTARSDTKLALDPADEEARKILYKVHCQMAEGMWVGPVPGNDFLVQCVDDDDPSRTPEALEALARKVFKDVPIKNGEKAFYAAVKDSAVCKKLYPLDTHSFRVEDMNAPAEKYGPDFMMVILLDGLDKKGVLRQRTTIGQGVLVGDQKQQPEDPLRAIDGTVLMLGATQASGTVYTHDTPEMRKARGQLGVYFTVMMSNSHRTKAYGFVLVEDEARLLIADHSGVVYSSLFNWRKTGILLAFLARIDAMTPAQYGWDTSVKLIRKVHWQPSEEQRELHREACWVADAKRILEKSDALPAGMTADSIFPSKGKPGPYSLFYQYNVDARKFHRIVAFRPLDYEDTGLVGSDARWFIGVDLDDEIVVYFKDCWRIGLSDIPTETQTYKELKAAGVPHILELHFGSDVPVDTPGLLEKCTQSSEDSWRRRISEEDHKSIEYQKTFTYQFAQDNLEKYSRNISDVGELNDGLLEMLPRTHHRIFFTTIPAKLTQFSSTRQLVACISDALEAHQAAYEDAGILHRKIDGRSVVFDKHGHGYLTNWEQAKATAEDDARRTKTRIGTLQTLAAEVLQRFLQPTPYLLRHDLESFVHLLYYSILRYRPPDRPSVQSSASLPQPVESSSWVKVLSDMRNIYDQGTPNSLNQLVDAGGAKATFMAGQGQNLSIESLQGSISPAPLWKLMFDIRQMFREVYLPPPVLRPGPTVKHRKEHDQEYKRWEKRREKARERLTSVGEFRAHFLEALASDSWPEGDGAVDQYLLDTRPPSGGLKAHGGNPANGPRQNLAGGTKRQRVESYSAGAGNLPAPNKRRKVVDAASESQLEDEDEDVEAPFDPIADKDTWTLKTRVIMDK